MQALGAHEPLWKRKWIPEAELTSDRRHRPENRFFSFRKAGRATGQMVGFVVRV
jgi:hypothetical protein